jgi:hypothetical protein
METINTNLGQKVQDTKKSPAPQRDPNEVAVRELYFAVIGGRDIGLDTSGGSGKLRCNDRREITYLPVKRFYRVTEINGEGTKVRYIPESWAAFEPLE